MAKKTSSAAPVNDIRVRYDLFDLPTAQHKAGLAGLLLQIESLVGRKQLRKEDVIVAVSTTSAELRFTKASIRSIFDDVYSAKRVEVAVRSKWPSSPPKEERMVDDKDDEGKLIKTKRYIYEVVQPEGIFLQERYPDGEGLWLKLWRDMIWAIPRGIPLTRKPYEERLAGMPCKLGKDAWDDLVKVDRARAKNEFYTTGLAGSLWLGAQDTNAESVPFQGRAEHNLLLHFWPLTVLVCAPQQITMEGETEFVGFAVAIPEVADLEGFIQDYPRMLSELDTVAHGYRPSEAVIDLPDEGGLIFLEHLAQIMDQKTGTGASPLSFSVDSVDFLHMKKEGNRILLLASGRIAPNERLLRLYQQIAGKKSPYHNPLFRRGLLLALLNQKPWFQPFARMLAEWPAPLFVNSEESPRNLSWFWADARKKFQEVIQAMPTDPAEPSEPDDRLAELIHRLVRTYIGVKTKEKSGIDPDKFKEGDRIQWDKLPTAYADARRQIAESLFLEYRSRRDQAFIDQFVARLGSVKQYIADDDFIHITRALMHRTDDVKTLTLLSLSANS
jgi:CRISPR-associated protein Cmx8